MKNIFKSSSNIVGRAQGGNGETRKYTLYLLKSTRRRNIFVIVVEEIIFASGRNIQTIIIFRQS